MIQGDEMDILATSV